MDLKLSNLENNRSPIISERKMTRDSRGTKSMDVNLKLPDISNNNSMSKIFESHNNKNGNDID